MRRPLVAFVCLLGVCWFVAQVWLSAPQNIALGQGTSKAKAVKKKSGTSNVLDVKANEIQGEFMKSAEALAVEYYDLKEYDKARALLKSIQALDPDRPNLEAKLKLLDEDMISANEAEVELNVAHNEWEPTKVVVAAGKPIRIKAAGAYKFVMSSQVGPKGFVPSTPASSVDLVDGLPLGALIGFINPSTPSTPTDPADRTPAGQGGDKDDKKKDRPFLIGEGCEYTPKKDGILSVRVNVPPENKNTGKIKVLITGGVRVLK